MCQHTASVCHLLTRMCMRNRRARFIFDQEEGITSLMTRLNCTLLHLIHSHGHNLSCQSYQHHNLHIATSIAAYISSTLWLLMVAQVVGIALWGDLRIVATFDFAGSHDTQGPKEYFFYVRSIVFKANCECWESTACLRQSQTTCILSMC